MISTRLIDRFDLRHPVLSAPMAKAAGAWLAAAVTRAGGAWVYCRVLLRCRVDFRGTRRGGQRGGGLRVHHLGVGGDAGAIGRGVGAAAASDVPELRQSGAVRG